MAIAAGRQVYLGSANCREISANVGKMPLNDATLDQESSKG